MTRLAKHTRVVINHGMHANSKELISTICHTVLADGQVTTDGYRAMATQHPRFMFNKACFPASEGRY